MFEVPYCPNPECEQESLKHGETCPKCGTPSKEIGLREANELIRQKKLHKKVEGGAKEILITPEMSDEEIQKRIYQDMMNLAMHEAGTGWMRLGTLLSFNTTEQMLGAGFKALIDQNKIIIRQNELILRAIRKETSKG